MFLRCNRRKKDGKVHEYWNVVENRRLSDGRVVQRQVLYLGEINASQREAWRKTVEVFDEGRRRQVALFPVGSLPGDDVDAIGGGTATGIYASYSVIGNRALNCTTNKYGSGASQSYATASAVTGNECADTAAGGFNS